MISPDMDYLFEAEDGSQVTVDFPIGKAPKLFSGCITVGGRTYRRVPSVGSVAASPNFRVTSHQLPRWYPYAKHFDSQGRPRIEGKKEIKEVIARAQHHGDKLDWD